MSTSDRVVIAEAAGAAFLVVGPTVLLSPHDVMLAGFALHPVWLPIILLSARYATRGFFPVMVFGWGSLIAASLALDGSLDGFAAHTHSSVDLFALAITILVAWIAMMHESRIARAVHQLTEESEAHRHAQDNVNALHASLDHLRNRHDRLAMSISLWRSLSRRLEHGDPADAAKAVLELCEIRAGARAGVVQLRDGHRLVALARRGQWAPDTARAHELEEDTTVQAAIRTRLVCPAVSGATELDSDVAIPVLDEVSGEVIGMIALRGVSPSCMRAGDLRDVGVIAQWLAPSLMRMQRGQHARSQEVGS